MVPPYFTDSLRLPASLSRIHSLSTLTGASRHSLLVPASEYISLTFFLIVRLLILHGSGFRCAALGCIRSLFLRAPLTCRLLSVRSGGTVLLPFIAFFLSYVCVKHELIIASLRFSVNTKNTIYSSGQGRWDTSSFLSRSINSFTA